MKLLLDTHAFIWWDSEPSKLSSAALAALRDSTNEVWCSVVSVWEILIKEQMGKLSLHLPLADIVAHQRTNGLRILPVTLEHVLGVNGLPRAHKDPFDRLLAAQANQEGATLVSADVVFARYPVAVLW
ncbi:MAG: type II toxin-antitoxin system VapC family toxin [Pirellulales bacterium]